MRLDRWIVLVLILSVPGLAHAQTPPGGSVPPTELPATPVPTTPPTVPMPPVAPPSTAPAPALPLPSAPGTPESPRGRAFANAGVVELGGSVGLSFDYFVDGKDRLLSLDLSFYAGWFVARSFVLGAYLSLPYSQYWGTGTAENDYWRISPGIVLAPGFAVGLGGSRVFLFGDLLLGIHGVKQSSSYSGYHGEIGAELGIKVVVGTNYLLRLGLRPAYFLGKLKAEGSTYEGDIKQFNLMLRLGFSGFL